jgi:hypothetical protein
VFTRESIPDRLRFAFRFSNSTFDVYRPHFYCNYKKDKEIPHFVRDDTIDGVEKRKKWRFADKAIKRHLSANCHFFPIAPDKTCHFERSEKSPVIKTESV